MADKYQLLHQHAQSLTTAEKKVYSIVNYVNNYFLQLYAWILKLLQINYNKLSMHARIIN